MSKVTMFGVGSMGSAIAECLIKKGHELTITVHRNPEGPKKLESLGAVISPDKYKAVNGAEYILVCVPADEHVKELLLDPAMIEAVKPGQVIIDLSTTSSQTIQEASAPYVEKGIGFIDAPLTGAPAHAYEGQITLLCGCEESVYDQAKAFMADMSKQQWYLGGIGSGKVAKICNNMITACSKLLYGEIAKIIKANHVDGQGFVNVISTSPNHSNQFDMVFPLVFKEDFTPKFAVKLMRKDVRLAMELADGLNCEVCEKVYEMYRRAFPFDEEDSNAVVKAENLPA